MKDRECMGTSETGKDDLMPCTEFDECDFQLLLCELSKIVRSVDPFANPNTNERQVSNTVGLPLRLLLELLLRLFLELMGFRVAL